LKLTDPDKIIQITTSAIIWGVRVMLLMAGGPGQRSTFCSTVNTAASYIVRDFQQPLFKPKATQKEFVTISSFAFYVR